MAGFLGTENLVLEINRTVCGIFAVIGSIDPRLDNDDRISDTH